MDPSDKYRSFFQMPRRTNIQNERRVTFVEQRSVSVKILYSMRTNGPACLPIA